jgi:acetyl esterase
MLRPYVWLVCVAARRHPRPLDTRPPAERRAERKELTSPPAPPDLQIEEIDVPVSHGTVRVRSYRPVSSRHAVTKRTGAHLFAHGGSFWSGSVDQVDAMARRYARTARCRVLSVDYRLAPEHQWPAAIEDYYGVLTWVADNAAELDVDPNRISVGGVSCGANLAAVATLLARDRRGPGVCHQVLEIGCFDATQSCPSMTELATGYLVTTAELDQGWEYYLPDGTDFKDPLVSPLFAEDHAGLPPATILVCEYDPLRDEGKAYAERLREAGVPVQLICARGHIHSSTYSQSVFLPSARRYQRRVARALRRALRPSQ